MIRIVRRSAAILMALALIGAGVTLTSTPSLAATASSSRPMIPHQARAASGQLGLAAPATARVSRAKAKGRWASGYTGAQVHARWAGPGVGLIAWTVGLSMNTYKGNAYKSCHSNWTGVNIDVAWNSASLHNGAQLVIIDSVKLSNGKWRDVGPALTISKAVSWPGHPAFDGQYHALVYTPGNVYVVLGHIESWISNGGVPYPDPTGSGDSVTLKQFKRC